MEKENSRNVLKEISTKPNMIPEKVQRRSSERLKINMGSFSEARSKINGDNIVPLKKRRSAENAERKITKQVKKSPVKEKKQIVANNDRSTSSEDEGDNSESPGHPSNKKIKVDHESSSVKLQASPTHGLSEYDKQIQANIAKRNEFLASLGISKIKDELSDLTPKIPAKPKYRGIPKTPKSPIEPTERRRSLRQQNLRPDGQELPLPSVRNDTHTNDTDRDSRPDPGPIRDFYKSAIYKENFEILLEDLQEIKVTKGKESVWSGSPNSVLKTMKSMKITETLVAKVAPTRIFSAQIHPTVDKTLVIVGGKWGEIGIWDVFREDESHGAYYFSPHARPVNSLTVHKENPHHIYSTSYDGSCRRTDLISGIVDQVYCISKECENRLYVSWHCHQDANNIMIGESIGNVSQIDLRAAGKVAKKYPVHNRKSVKVVTVHPTQNHYFATCSSDRTVCLWDSRKHKCDTPLSSVTHGKVVSGLQFSPLTGNTLISTSKDDFLRFISCDLKDLKVERKIRHFNQTGRWLTSFKAHFVPEREDMVVVGALLQPRRIEVWGCDGHLQHEFRGEHFGSVASITAMHPTRPIIAGCNSSGRVSVFM